MKYRNSQADIGIEFDYNDKDDLKMNFEGIMFDLMEFIAEYNLEEECVDYLNLHNTYYLHKTQIVDNNAINIFCPFDF